MDDFLKDGRFSNLIKDKKYKKVPKQEQKVKIDKRFQSMFHDKKFKIINTVDNKGKPVDTASSENLKKYYHLSSEDEDDSDSESEASDENEESQISDENSQEIKVPKKDSLLKSTKNVAKKIKDKVHDSTIDYARGEGSSCTDSSSDESSSEDDQDDEIEHKWGEMDNDAETTEVSTSRLALCNMDWDKIEALDLLVLFKSFIPSTGLIKSITIYPSEYGLERLKEENLYGPKELRAEKTIQQDEESNGEDDEELMDMEKLRKYQINRLKYYYAVIECDSISTANILYKECDGLEYEDSGSKIDLRFIPEDMTFDQEPREKCNEVPDLRRYEPPSFITTALNQGKVDLTWDETDPRRTKSTRKKLSKKNQDDDDMENFRAYLASPSEESEDDDINKDSENATDNLDPISTFKQILKEIEEKEEEKKNKDVEMEITWGLGDKEKAKKLVKEIMKKNQSMTPFEEMMEKKKEKKQQKMKEKKKKKESNENQSDISEDDDIPSDVDLNDPFFKDEIEKLKTNQNNNKKKESKNEQNDSEKKNQAELELLLMDGDDNKAHFNYKKIQEQHENKKKKGKTKNVKKEIAEDNFEVNVKDERFKALYTDHLFNIDPTDPHYKNTKGMEAIYKEKISRRRKSEHEESSPPLKIPRTETNKHAALSSMIKSFKSKPVNIKKKI